MYKAIIESISTHTSEVWVLNKSQREILKVKEMDHWRRSCRVSKLEHLSNDESRRMKMDGNIRDTINKK